MKPPDYSSLREKSNSLLIKQSQFKDCDEFLNDHEESGMHKDKAAYVKLVDAGIFYGAANHFEKYLIAECFNTKDEFGFRIPDKALEMYLAVIQPSLVDGEEELPRGLGWLN